jgi:DNA-binding NtrC family response regulator
MTPTTIKSSNTSNKFQSVIVHERDKGLRKALAITLIDYFYETRLTESVSQLLDLLNETKPSVMLLDLTDNELTYETIGFIRKVVSKCRIVLTYVELSEMQKDSLMKIGVNHLIEKPYNLEKLVDYLDKLKGVKEC